LPDRFDHALIGVADLEAARRSYRRLGFTVCPRGKHIGWGTANYCIMFPDDYLELLGIVDASQFTNNLDKFLDRHGEGLLGMCFSSDDIDALGQRLDIEPTNLKRLLELPEGTVEPRFRLLHPAPDALPGLSGFFCQHLTPELMRRPDWLVHANGAIGIASLTIAVADIAEAAKAYGRFFGEGSVRLGDDQADIVLGKGRLRLISSDQAEGLVELAVQVADMATTALYMDTTGVACEQAPEGLLIAPQEACGAALSFVR